MRVTAVDMYSDNVYPLEPISFSLLDSDPRDQYAVRTIIGLDAEEIIPKFYAMSNDKVYKFYDYSLKARDIVMRIVLKPRFDLDESYADVRDELYKTISGTRTGRVKLHFRSGSTTVAGIFGQIIKFESALFTKLPEVQLTIRCNNPMFEAINPVVFDADEMTSTNPVSIPDSLSTAPHGFTMSLVFTDDPETFTIHDSAVDPTWYFAVAPDTGFEVGDILHFSSVYSDKYLYIERGVDTIQLADKILPGSIWPILFPGANFFHFLDLASFDWITAQYSASYWGV